ncbi:MAG: tetratricopeptide repeat protein [Crocinitomicaceae bacterium]
MKKILGIFALIVVLVACSTENAGFLSRKYHGTTARYNGLFNANELLKGTLKTYYSSRKEDFYSVLPVNPLPSESEVKGMLPALDTAISKCTKVIQNHSMPSAENMYYKEVEYNRWIDENWMIIGKTMFYKRDYEKAFQNFQFIKKFFSKDPSTYTAELWSAKILIEQEKYAEAKLSLDGLSEISQAQKKRKLREYLPQIFVKKSEEKEKQVRLNRNIQFDIYKASADLAIQRKDNELAINMLNLAIKKSPNVKEKTRLSYILAQLFQQEKQLDSAAFFYAKSVRPSASFDISFNGRLNEAICGSGKGMDRKLKIMLRDAKNATYKDQIYFALARVELNQNDIKQAKFYLTQSAFYSNNNKRQRAMAYETLGDLCFKDRDYISAQKYYDSCSRFVTEDYPNGKDIKNKAVKLADLVKAVETAAFEDSVQRIAKMSEKERNEFLRETLKKMKEDIQRKKELEAQKLLALQSQQNNDGGNNTNKFVFNNPKLRETGFNEFQKQWGPRENEDDWRRSNKIVFNNAEDDSTLVNNENQNDVKDSLTVEQLLADIPLSDSAFQASRLKMQEAYYQAGVLYKEVLNESSLAGEQFESALAVKEINLTDLSSAFQLYKLNEQGAAANKYRNHIIVNYPNSDAAKYFEDPDFYIKQKASQQQAQVKYLSLIELYENGKYHEVMEASDKIIATEPANALRAEYLLLNALAFGQINENKQELVPKLKKIIEEKPGTPQAQRAKEMLDIIKNGYSKNEPVNFNKNYSFSYNPDVAQYVIVLMDEEDDVDDAKGVISDFTTRKLKLTKMKISSKLTLTEKHMVLIQEFSKIKDAEDFVNAYKAGFEDLGEYQDNNIYIITQENLKKLIESSKFEEYKLFYDDNY